MTAPRSPKRGPRGAEAHTRDDILRAALVCFSARGYSATSMRAIAKEAGVDPSLPRHYFSSKSMLFVEALGPLAHLPGQVSAIASGSEDQIGERILRVFLFLWESPESGPRLRILLTTAASTPEIGEVLKRVMFGTIFAQVEQATGRDDAALRASAIASQMMGLALARYILSLEPLASATTEEIVARFAPSIQLLATGDSS